jgi:hypothetical protein
VNTVVDEVNKYQNKTIDFVKEFKWFEDLEQKWKNVAIYFK